MNREDTDIILEGLRADLKFEQLHRVKWWVKTRKKLAHFPLLRKKVLKAPRLLKVGLLRPVERKPI